MKEIIQDDSSTCWRSDTSDNSISSFTFPMYNSALFLWESLHRKKTQALILFCFLVKKLNSCFLFLLLLYGRLLYNEYGSVKTPTMETRWNVFDKRLQLSQPQTQPQLQFYFIPAAATHTLTRLPPPRKSPSLNQASEMQAHKTFRNRWFSCFYCPFQRDWSKKLKKAKRKGQ